MFRHARELLTDREVASIAPTSSACVSKICESIPFDDCKTIVEFGPGDGAFTQYLLRKMPATSSLVAIETNAHFVEILRSNFFDPRLRVVEGDAALVSKHLAPFGVNSVDLVLCGLPFSFLSPEEKAGILAETAKILAPTGKVIIYQSLIAPEGLRSLKKALQNHFVLQRTYSLLLNLPPLFVFEASRIDARAVTNDVSSKTPSPLERGRQRKPLLPLLKRKKKS